jgi:AraC family transcriptional regulator
MLCSAAWRGEHTTVTGAFAPHRKTAGALTAVPDGPLPAARSLQPCDLLYCAFDPGLLLDVRSEIDGKVPSLGFRSGVRDHAITQILNLLLAEVERGDVSPRLYIDSLAHALAVRFLFLGEKSPSPSFGSATLTRNKLARVQELIESRLDSDLSLRELAATAGYSRSHFLRAFRATTGMTPHRYVLHQRIERAGRLLRDARMSISEVAYRCGFSSQSHLTSALRKVWGLTPAEYRRQL